MATTVRISKALEASLRLAASLRADVVELVEVVTLIDKAQAKRRDSGAGPALSVSAFVDVVKQYRPVILPQHADKEGVYARLSKALQKCGVTTEQAHALGAWLKAQAWPPELTVEYLTRSLGESLSKALATRPAFKRSPWAASGVDV